MSNGGPKLPAIPAVSSVLPPDMRQFVDAVRQILQVQLAQTPNGSPLDATVTFRDLQNSSGISISFPFDPLTGTSTPAINAGSPAELNFTPPPAPTTVTASGSLTSIFVSWDSPTYSNHSFTEVWRQPVTLDGYGDPIASNLGSATLCGTVNGYATLYPDPVGTSGDYWYWVRFVSAAAVKGPFNAVSGVRGQTSASPTYLLSVLTNALTSSQLASALSTRIDLIDAADTVAGSMAYRVAAEAAARGTAVSNEVTLRQAGDNALAQSISLLTASSAGSFDTYSMWYFDTTVEGWTSSGATQAANNGWLEQTSTGTNPQLISPSGLSLLGSKYATVKARIKRLAGTTGWTGKLYYTTSGHGFSASYYKLISVPSPFAVGDIAVIDFDMQNLTAGGNDWINSTITQLRLDLGGDATDVIALDWIGVGRNAPGASVAALGEESQARISGDQAEATYRQTLASQLTGFNDPTGKVLADLTTGLVYQEKSARTSADSANASSISTLSAQVNHASTGLPAAFTAITSEASTRASADTANASAITTLQSTLIKQPTMQNPFFEDGKNYWAGVGTYTDAYTEPWPALTGGTIENAGDQGGKVLQAAGNELWVMHGPLIAIDRARNYKGRFKVKQTVASGTTYAGVVHYTAAGVYVVNDWAVLSGASVPVDGVWHTYEYTYPANGFGSTVAYVRPWFILNYGGIGTAQADSFEFFDIHEAQLASAAVAVEASTRATQTGDLNALYTVKLDVNGVMSGIGLASTLIEGGSITSKFLASVDNFGITAPVTSSATEPGTKFVGMLWKNTSGGTINGVAAGATGRWNGTAWTAQGFSAMPFAVLTTTQTINGVTFDPGVYMDGAMINNGTVTANAIAAGTITADKITTSSLSSISANLGAVTAGSLNINNKFTVDTNGNVVIRSAATGARLEVANNVIKVFDSNGVCRVKIGDLTA